LARQAADSYPRLTLDQLLAGYDRTEHRSGWPNGAPVGGRVIIMVDSIVRAHQHAVGKKGGLKLVRSGARAAD